MSAAEIPAILMKSFIVFLSVSKQMLGLTNFMVQGLTWAVVGCSAGQEIPCFYGTWRFITEFTELYPKL